MLFVHVSGELLVWSGVGCPCPHVRNDIVTPCHLFEYLFVLNMNLTLIFRQSFGNFFKNQLVFFCLFLYVSFFFAIFSKISCPGWVFHLTPERTEVKSLSKKISWSYLGLWWQKQAKNRSKWSKIMFGSVIVSQIFFHKSYLRNECAYQEHSGVKTGQKQVINGPKPFKVPH